MNTLTNLTSANALSQQLRRCKVPAATLALAVCAWLSAGATARADTLPFDSTSQPSQWQVATKLGGIDGDLASFPVSGFETAIAVAGRDSGGTGWIANNSTGTNFCCVGNWTFFVFRQTFDLGAYDPGTAVLSFRWAADDSGEGFASRGSWTPKFRLNNGPLINGNWPTGATYALGSPTRVDSGFQSGLNSIDFFVQGNGVTDGMAFVGTLTAAVPEPPATALLLAGLACIGRLARRRARLAVARVCS